jgi:hypothetical protein
MNWVRKFPTTCAAGHAGIKKNKYWHL